MRYKIYIIIGLILGLLVGGIAGFELSKSSLKGLSLGYVGKAHEYRQKNNYLKAMAYFNRAIALDPNSFMARISLPKTYSLAGYYDIAIEEYEATLEIALAEKWDDKEINRIKLEMEEIKKRLNK